LILGALGPSTDVVLVLVRRLVSDALPVAGAHRLLTGTAYRELGLDELAGAHGDTALILGGSFSRSDGGLMARALAVAELRFRRVVVLPASFDRSDEEVNRVLAQTSATVFARERESFQAIAELCDAHLAHDCSFFFDLDEYRAAGEGVLNAFSDDGVGFREWPVPSDNDDISITASDVQAWLKRISAAETVRTDRSHVMIAAALMGKSVEYVEAAEPGLRSVASEMLADYRIEPIRAQTARSPVRPASLNRTTEETLKRLTTAALESPRPGGTNGSRVTAVLLTRDRPELLLRALASLEQSDTPVHRVVIDNNSSPAGATALRELCAGIEKLELRRAERNLGCGGGRQLGIELADSELVLFLDDDAELLPGALDHLVFALDQHPDVGAVTATVVQADGVVFHSGGSMEVDRETATFTLLCNSDVFDPDALPPSGPAGWCPGTAMVARRTFLEEFPLDTSMGTHFEDNEWCYRVSRNRSGAFWRSREALVLHNAQPKESPGGDFASRSRAVEFIASYARFYELHGLLLGPFLFQHHLPELQGDDGSRDLSAARLLMELVIAKGTDWTLMAWMNGDLEGLLTAQRRLVKLRVAEEELSRERALVENLHSKVRQQEEQLAELGAQFLATSQRLSRIEESLIWQLFQRTRAVLFKLLGGEGSRAVEILQRALRLVGRRLIRPRS
jgi:GT2 family glycosyltransferase